jgi:hypothetical protein
MLYRHNKICSLIVLVPFMLAGHAPAQAPAPERLQEALQRVQAANAQNQEALHSYQWIETTTATINGNPRPPRQQICKYAADGSVQKTPLGSPAGRQGAGGAGRGGLIRGMVAKDKKEKFEKEAKEIHTLAAMYMPLDRAKFADALRDGRSKVEQGENDESIVVIDGYAKPGDQMKITLNHMTGHVLRVSVKSWFDKPKDVFTGDVQFSTLGDGTFYPSATAISAPSKDMSISIVNSNYAKALN